MWASTCVSLTNFASLFHVPTVVWLARHCADAANALTAEASLPTDLQPPLDKGEGAVRQWAKAMFDAAAASVRAHFAASAAAAAAAADQTVAAAAAAAAAADHAVAAIADHAVAAAAAAAEHATAVHAGGDASLAAAAAAATNQATTAAAAADQATTAAEHASADQATVAAAPNQATDTANQMRRQAGKQQLKASRVQKALPLRQLDGQLVSWDDGAQVAHWVLGWLSAVQQRACDGMVPQRWDGFGMPPWRGKPTTKYHVAHGGLFQGALWASDTTMALLKEVRARRWKGKVDRRVSACRGRGPGAGVRRSPLTVICSPLSTATLQAGRRST